PGDLDIALDPQLAALWRVPQRDIHGRAHCPAKTRVFRVGAQRRGVRDLVAAADGDVAIEHQTYRPDLHEERSLERVLARGLDRGHTRHAARGDGHVHDDRPHALDRGGDHGGVGELQADALTSRRRSARSVHTRAISRLYAAEPRTSSIGSTSPRTSAAASAIRSARWPVIALSTARARIGRGPTPPRKMRTRRMTPSATSPRTATDTVA